MTNKAFYLSTVAGFAALLAAGAANATPITYTTYTLGNPVNHQTDVNQNLTVTLFDPGLGTLTGVQFNLVAGLSSVFSISAGSSGATTAYGEIQFTDALKDPDLVTLLSHSSTILSSQVYNTLTPNQMVTTPTATLSFSSADTFQANTLSYTDLSFTDAALLGDFTGTGAGQTSNMNYTTTTATLAGYTGGNASTTQTTYVTLSGTVTYAYTPTETPPPPGVPEPMTLSVLGAGLAGLAALRRRRRA